VDKTHAAARLCLLLAILPILALTFSSTRTQQSAVASNRAFGSFGPEGPRMREQLWVRPGADPEYPLRATVFRPNDAASLIERRPLVVINHGTSEGNRLSTAMPVYYWLSRWFVDRGYVVVLPQRRGHGATGGPLAEAIGDCAHPDHYQSGLVAAGDIAAATRFMTRQPFVDPARTLVIGISTGGWASLALAAQDPGVARAVINFAGGRGGHAGGEPNAVCGEKELIDAAREYGKTARTPTLWLYAANDSYFAPALAKRMAAAWQEAGGTAQLDVLPSYGRDGHDLANDRAGWEFWGDDVSKFLDVKFNTPAEPQIAQGP
jgi:dienelactone hydrolase